MYEYDIITSTPKRCALTEVTNSSYVSPTANLKLLTNVALQYPTPPPSTVHRKEKSLQILCDKFLNLYPLHCNGTMEIQLDSTAARLGVEKRRMYDIINILEAMQCAVHKRKNTYLWHGGSRLNSFLKMLKKQGENLRLSEALRGRAPKPPAPKHKTLGVLAQRFLMLFLVEPQETAQLKGLEPKELKVFMDGSKTNEGVGSGAFSEGLNIHICTQLGTHNTVFQAECMGIIQAAIAIDARKVKHFSIRILTNSMAVLQALSCNAANSKLIYECHQQLNENTLINLEMAVKVLIDTSNKNKTDLSPEQLDRQHKSKVRRLYDIANVFISIGLIEKVSGNLILKKPVFKYVGPYKIKKPDKAAVTIASPITPLSVLDTQEKMTPCHVFASKSKRKLEFTTPDNNTKLGVTTPPDTPSHKWDEILLVANMELNRINNGILL